MLCVVRGMKFEYVHGFCLFEHGLESKKFHGFHAQTLGASAKGYLPDHGRPMHARAHRRIARAVGQPLGCIELLVHGERVCFCLQGWGRSLRERLQ